jgi:hypothetical protein
MARFAKGKYAYLIDDRTGRKIRYRDAKTEWTGARVHKSEFEEKHPNLDPAPVPPPAETLRDPRPDADDDLGVDTQLETAMSAAGIPSTFGAT